MAEGVSLPRVEEVVLPREEGGGWRREGDHGRGRLFDDHASRWGRGGDNGGDFATDCDGAVARGFEVETLLGAAVFAFVDGSSEGVH